jgi:hypothetical protein
MADRPPLLFIAVENIAGDLVAVFHDRDRERIVLNEASLLTRLENLHAGGRPAADEERALQTLRVALRLGHVPNEGTAFEGQILTESERDRLLATARKPGVSMILSTQRDPMRDCERQWEVRFAPSTPRGSPKEAQLSGAAIDLTASPQMPAVVIDYTNHAGVRAKRRIQPLRFRFGTTPKQDTPRYLIDAIDLERNVERSFSLQDIHSWTQE